MVQLNEELLAALDDEAQRRGMSRSAVIREAVASHLSASVRAEIARRIVEGYRRVPPGVPDEWGDVEAAADRSTIETLQRLDAEERAAGLDPW